MSGRGSCSIRRPDAPAAWLYSPERLHCPDRGRAPVISPDGLAQFAGLEKGIAHVEVQRCA